jgi:hypothetical protein
LQIIKIALDEKLQKKIDSDAGNVFIRGMIA